ncbi:MAG TPA: hypothetical protein VGG28_12230 [Kofleriaceae bacterium]
MRIVFGLVLVLACDAGRKDAPTPAPRPATPRVVADAAVVIAPDAALPTGPTLLHPVGMTGPFPTIDDACLSAKPCGFTALDEHGNNAKPATKTNCAMGQIDENAYEPDGGGTQAEIDHVTPNGVELRIASQNCDMPKEIRGEQDIYFMFVKRADGWWRSDALWQYSYNDKYAGGMMHVRWNDQPGRTFAGIAAAITSLTCEKQGDELTTDELMVRVEAGSAHPLVWAPIVVGRRFEQARRDDGARDVDCPKIKTATSLDEKWTSSDDLQLVGSATWDTIERTDGMLSIGWSNGSDASAAGAYQFVR